MPFIPNNYQVVEPEYRYSEPIVIKKWNGGQIDVKIGYVRQHPERKKLVLEKYWVAKGGMQNYQIFNVKDPEDWKKICMTVDKLWPEIINKGTSTEIRESVKAFALEHEMLDVFSQFPELLRTLPDNIDLLKLMPEHKQALVNLLKAGNEIAIPAIKRLSEEPIPDLETLVKILENYKLSTVNSLFTHVTARLAFIDTFEKVIHDDSSFERRGDNSVHSFLKQNIWIIDRNYTILHDDETLKNIIAQRADDVPNIPEGNTRPDFLCMTNSTMGEDSLDIVIIEIKRPTVSLKFEHMEQVLRYESLLRKYSGKNIRSFKVVLIGRELDQLMLHAFAKEHIVRTYTDFIGEARRFYQEYRKILEIGRYAV